MFPKHLITIGLLASILVSSCSRGAISDQALTGRERSSSSSNGDGLVLQGPKAAVPPGGMVSVSASGGVEPYSYYMVSGSGSVEPATGLFTASLTQGTVQVGVRDSAGKVATTTISVGQGWGSSLVLTPASGPITVTQRVTLKATGGAAPYFYGIVAGEGSIVGDVYTAPASTGAVTLIVVDSRGGSATVSYSIQAAQALSISPTTKSMVAGTVAAFTASGGVPPYSFSVVFGGGSFSNGIYTASLIAGPARVRVADAQGSEAYADVTITPNYTNNHQSNTFSLFVDHYVAFSYDNSTDREHPSFTFWGNGPTPDAANVAKNCPAYTGLCAYVVTLNNFSNSNFAYATYRGTISMGGRGASGRLSFCISPEDTTRARIRWEEGAGFTAQVRFNIAGKTLFQGVPALTAYTVVDTASGAGSATLNFDGAYTADLDCGDFVDAYEVVVNPQ